MGRRRRKVIRIPKKRLPKFFDCPECGKPGTIGIHISPQKPIIIARCGECAEEDRKDFLGDKEVKLECRNESCPNSKLSFIVRIKPLSESMIMVECGKCHGRNILELPLESAPLNCSCELSRQVRLTTRSAERLAMVSCGSCGLTMYLSANPCDEPVDIYGKFLDRYYGKE